MWLLLGALGYTFSQAKSPQWKQSGPKTIQKLKTLVANSFSTGFVKEVSLDLEIPFEVFPFSFAA